MCGLREALVVALAMLLLTAGCVAPAVPGVDQPADGGNGNGDDGASGTTGEGGGDAGRAGTSGGGSGSDGTGTEVVGPVDPYGGKTLVVAIDYEVDRTRDYAPLVRRALAFWEANASRHAGYDVSYRLEPGAAEPDFVVSVVDRIGDCGSVDDHSAGCAPYITGPQQFSPPERIRVVQGLSDESTVQVLIHEFGHTLGLGHDDEPQSVMRARGRLATLPRTDARNRSYAWADDELTLYVDVQNDAGDRPTVERQVRETIAYFDRGADGTVPENVSFVRTSNRSRADVVVQVGGTNPCDGDSGSCRRIRGLDPDVDNRLETYDRLEVYVFGLEPEAVGWHVGRHLGYTLGLNEEAEYPQPLRSSASYEDRRTEWWVAE
jgi:hypothetical protein